MRNVCGSACSIQMPEVDTNNKSALRNACDACGLDSLIILSSSLSLLKMNYSSHRMFGWFSQHMVLLLLLWVIHVS